MLKKDFSPSIKKNGVEIKAQLPLYLFMYPNSVLAIDAVLGGGNARVASEIPMEKAEEADVLALLEKVEVCPCKKCGAPAFDPASVSTNRDGMCEKCFIEKLNAEFEVERKKEEKKIARQDKKMREKGFTHKVSAWIHPSGGGDDYQMDIYWKGEPSAAEINAELKKSKSRVLDDYRIVSLGG